MISSKVNKKISKMQKLINIAYANDEAEKQKQTDLFEAAVAAMPDEQRLNKMLDMMLKIYETGVDRSLKKKG